MFKKLVITLLCLGSPCVHAWHIYYNIPHAMFYNGARLNESNHEIQQAQPDYSASQTAQWRPAISEKTLGGPFFLNILPSLQAYNTFFIEPTAGLFLSRHSRQFVTPFPKLKNNSSHEGSKDCYNTRWDCLFELMGKWVTPIKVPVLSQLKIYTKGGLWAVFSRELSEDEDEQDLAPHDRQTASGLALGAGVMHPIINRVALDLGFLWNVPLERTHPDDKLAISESFLTIKLGITVRVW